MNKSFVLYYNGSILETIYYHPVYETIADAERALEFYCTEGEPSEPFSADVMSINMSYEDAIKLSDEEIGKLPVEEVGTAYYEPERRVRTGRPDNSVWTKEEWEQKFGK